MPVLPDWYCCLSVALDAEEDEWYNQQMLAYMAAGGDMKKFPKRRRRYGQTRSANVAPRAVEGPPEETGYDIVMDALKKANMPLVGMKGDIGTFAKARGLKKVFQMPDGTFTDEAGNPVEPTQGSVFVPSSK